MTLRATRMAQIKARLAPRRKWPWGAGNGPALVKSRNAELGYSCSPYLFDIQRQAVVCLLTDCVIKTCCRSATAAF